MNQDAHSKNVARWNRIVAGALVLLIPCMRFYFPLGDLHWMKIAMVFAGVWMVRSLPAPVFWRKWQKLQKTLALLTVLLPLLVFVPLILMFGAILAVFYVWVFVAAGLVLLGFAATMIRGRIPKGQPLVLFVVGIILAGCFCSWWNFLMIGAPQYKPSANSEGVRPVLLVDQIRTLRPDIGEAHPYAIAYDPDHDTLVGSFKDDWGAIFPRVDHLQHNFLAAVATKADEPGLRTLFLGKHQLPENLALDPAQRRGWVNVLDMEHRSFHVVAFGYNDTSIEQVGRLDLPWEPNAIFYDPLRNRVLVVRAATLGGRVEGLSVDPETLKPSSSFLLPMGPTRKGGLDLSQNRELAIMSARYDPGLDRLFIGTIGRFVHAFAIDQGLVGRASSWLIVVALSLNPDQGELLAAQPLNDTVLVVDMQSMATLKKLDVGVACRPVTHLPRTDWIVAGGYSQNRTVVVDKTSGRIVQTFRLGRLQRDAISDPSSRRAFVATGLGLFEIDADRLL